MRPEWLACEGIKAEHLLHVFPLDTMTVNSFGFFLFLIGSRRPIHEIQSFVRDGNTAISAADFTFP